jgi:hypothetical protein
MRVLNLRMAALALVGGVALGGCAYDTYGGGGGYGYGPYSGLSVGVGYGGGYGYGSPYYSDYYGSPFGWYDDFYYPGTGIYVYDSYRRPRMWNDRERRYWQHGGGSWHNGGNWHHRDGTRTNSNTRVTQPDWSGFDHHPGRHH